MEKFVLASFVRQHIVLKNNTQIDQTLDLLMGFYSDP